MNDFNFQLTSKGYLLSRETFDLEYKEAFHYGDELAEYTRSMVGMANNRGGKIIFGVKNTPRMPVGLKNKKFRECDQNIVNQFIQEYFSHDFNWEFKTLEFDNKEFGQIAILENERKPIICRKNYKNILKEAAIYYRYRGETKEIKYTELNQIIENERTKERETWIQTIQKISQIGPRNAQIVDVYNGELTINNEKILIDKTLLEKIKFIKEGHFVEKDGSPALILRGTVTGVYDSAQALPTDKIYPFQASHLMDKFKINQYQVKCLIYKLKIKGNAKYHDPVSSGKNSMIHKYSQIMMDYVEQSLRENPRLITDSCIEYQADLKSGKITNKKENDLI